MKMNAARLTIAALVIIGIFGLLITTFYFPLNEAEIELEDMMIGALIYAFKDVLAYFFRKE